MAAIAHMVLTAGIDKVLSWTTKPPVVIGEGGITDITITWPTELADYTKKDKQTAKKAAEDKMAAEKAKGLETLKGVVERVKAIEGVLSL